jgi:hypothetical protein
MSIVKIIIIITIIIQNLCVRIIDYFGDIFYLFTL